MSAFGNVKTDKEVKEVKDTVGGSFVDPTGAYDIRVKAIRLHETTSKTKAATIIYTQDGMEKEQTVYYANAQGENFNDYNGTKTLKPGWVILSDILAIGAGIDMTQATLVQKTLNVWNREAGQKVPTKVDIVEQSMGLDLKFGIIKHVKPKSKLVDGEWKHTTETMETNEISKVFAPDGRTALEIKGEIADPVFLTEKWLTKFNPDYIKVTEAKDPIDVSSGTESTGAAKSPGTAAPADDLDDL